MLIKQNVEIILASSSKIRQKILTESGFNFKVIKPFYDEDAEKQNLPKMPARQLAIFLAKEKALSVSRKFPNAYVIGSDQVCEFEENEISKSFNSKEALEQLSKFNGKTHFQNNGAVIALNGKIIFENFSRVEMKMRQISQEQIEQYVKIDEPWGCAGSYKYESLGKHLFDEVKGDYYSVLGLAIQPLISFFHSEKLISF